MHRKVYYRRDCCDVWTLSTIDQFRLPATNFAFGIAPSLSVSLLGFSGADYLVEQYIERIPRLVVGNTINVGDTNMGSALRLFQFVISKSRTISSSI